MHHPTFNSSHLKKMMLGKTTFLSENFFRGDDVKLRVYFPSLVVGFLGPKLQEEIRSFCWELRSVGMCEKVSWISVSKAWKGGS